MGIQRIARAALAGLVVGAVAAAAMAAGLPPVGVGAAAAIAGALCAGAAAWWAARPLERGAGEGEALLRAVVEGTPTAIVLLGETGRVVFANGAARELLFEGRPLEGHDFLAMVRHAPAAFRDAFLRAGDELFTVGEGDDVETYRLARRYFEQRGETQTLLMVERLTRELRRQEVDVWKKLIRVLSHELNNSLAPITSLVASARVIAGSPEHTHRLTRVFDTIEERALHLGEFLESYAHFARLPEPRREAVPWAELLGRLRALAPEVTIGAPPPGSGWLDTAQIEQVVLNLFKNSAEAGSPPEAISLDVSAASGGFELVVSDRGGGMSEEVLRRALLPFFSTKERGTGLGLALCREIIEAHGGKLRIQNREGGGLRVACWLPGPDAPAPPLKAKLTLSRP